jgi:transcriptional regulator with XRE-family HTH domain
MDTSEKIKRIIKEQGYTYESLGNEIGISPQAVSEIVNGRTKGATARYSLAKALGREVEDLWPEVERKRSA